MLLAFALVLAVLSGAEPSLASTEYPDASAVKHHHDKLGLPDEIVLDESEHSNLGKVDNQRVMGEHYSVGPLHDSAPILEKLSRMGEDEDSGGELLPDGRPAPRTYHKAPDVEEYDEDDADEESEEEYFYSEFDRLEIEKIHKLFGHHAYAPEGVDPDELYATDGMPGQTLSEEQEKEAQERIHEEMQKHGIQLGPTMEEIEKEAMNAAPMPGLKPGQSLEDLDDDELRRLYEEAMTSQQHGDDEAYEVDEQNAEAYDTKFIPTPRGVRGDEGRADEHSEEGAAENEDVDNHQDGSLTTFSFEVTGRVQGVYFRASTKEKAESLSITGWVANTRKGSVVGEAEGSKVSMAEFRFWLKDTGSPLSDIDDATFTDVKEGVRERKFDQFEIDYDYEDHHT